MTRIVTRQSVVLNTAENTTGKLGLDSWAGASIEFPNGTAAAILTFYHGENDQQAVFSQVEDGNGNAVSRTVDASVAAKTIPLPDECFASPCVKIVSSVACTVNVTLKD